MGRKWLGIRGAETNQSSGRIRILVQDTYSDSGYFTGFRILNRVQDSLQVAGYLFRFRILYRVQDTLQGS